MALADPQPPLDPASTPGSSMPALVPMIPASPPSPHPVELRPGGPNRWLSTATLLLVLVASTAVLVQSRGSGPTDRTATTVRTVTSAPATTTVPSRAFPTGVGRLTAGPYRTTTFRLPIDLSFDDGWQLDQVEGPDVIAFSRPESVDGYPYLTVVAAGRVLRADRAYATGSQMIAADAATVPEDLAAWLGTHPRLRVTNQIPASIGGSIALQIDFEVADGYASAACGDRKCVVLFRLDSPENQYRVFKIDTGDHMRLYLVPRDGQWLVVSVESPSSDFDRYMALAQPVVQSIRLRL